MLETRPSQIGTQAHFNGSIEIDPQPIGLIARAGDKLYTPWQLNAVGSTVLLTCTIQNL